MTLKPEDFVDIRRRVNGTDPNKEQDQITDGVDQLLDLMHILILAVNQNTLWLSERVSQGILYYFLNLSVQVPILITRSSK